VAASNIAVFLIALGGVMKADRSQKPTGRTNNSYARAVFQDIITS
jgi:hypothetical protein